MFCPKCGQQQASGEMRFCSRCGFQLGVVSALIATGGVPPAGFAVDSQTRTVLTTRQTRQGAKLMFAAGVVAPFAMGFSILFDSPTPLIIPFTIFLAGLAWMLYYRLFGEDALPSQQQSSPAQLDRTRLELLTLPQNPMVGDFNRPTYGTAEIVQPRSVTENTTKLLDEK